MFKNYRENHYFKYNVLPNGFAPALQEFTIPKLYAPPFVHLVSKEHVSLKCLDNSLLMEETAIMCLNHVTDTVVL